MPSLSPLPGCLSLLYLCRWTNLRERPALRPSREGAGYPLQLPYSMSLHSTNNSALEDTAPPECTGLLISSHDGAALLMRLVLQQRYGASPCKCNSSCKHPCAVPTSSASYPLLASMHAHSLGLLSPELEKFVLLGDCS